MFNHPEVLKVLTQAHVDRLRVSTPGEAASRRDRRRRRPPSRSYNRQRVGAAGVR